MDTDNVAEWMAGVVSDVLEASDVDRAAFRVALSGLTKELSHTHGVGTWQQLKSKMSNEEAEELLTFIERQMDDFRETNPPLAAALQFLALSLIGSSFEDPEIVTYQLLADGIIEEAQA